MDEKYPIINPTGIYTSSDLRELLGLSCLNVLRNNGLRAIGDRYLGSMVISCFHRAWKAKVGDDQQSELPQNKAMPFPKIKPNPRPSAKQASVSHTEQLEHSRRQLQEDKARAKKNRSPSNNHN